MPIFKTQNYDSYENIKQRERIIEEREQERQKRLAQKRREEAQRKEAEIKLAKQKAAQEEDRKRKQIAEDRANKQAELKRAQKIKQDQTKATHALYKKNPRYKEYEGYKQTQRQSQQQQKSIQDPFGLQQSSPFGTPKSMAQIQEGLNPYFKVINKPNYVKQQEDYLEKENKRYHDLITGKARFDNNVIRKQRATVQAIDKAYSDAGIELDDVDVPLITSDQPSTEDFFNYPFQAKTGNKLNSFLQEDINTNKDYLKHGLKNLWSWDLKNAINSPAQIANGVLGLAKDYGQMALYAATGNNRFNPYETNESAIEYTQQKFDQAVQQKKDQLNLNGASNIKVPKPSDYGFFDWSDDAYTSYQVQRNEAERDDFAGRVLINDEMLGYISNYEKYLNNLEYIDFIKALMRGEIGGYISNQGEVDTYSALLQKFNKLDEENPFVGADPKNMSFQELAKLKHKLEQDNLKYEQYKNIVESYEPGVFGTVLGTIGQAKDDLLGYGIKNKVLGSLPSLLDLEEDQLAIALNGLSEAKTNDERRQILNKYKNLSKEYRNYWTNAIKNNQKDIDRFENRHKVSEWYKAKEQDPNNGNDLLDLDTWLYKMPGQMGASSSSWIKQYPGMALKIAGALTATIGTGGTAALAGGTMAVTGSALSYGSAKSENYAQIFENGGQRFVQKLLASGQYDNVVKEGRYRTNQPDISDEEIIKQLQQGLWHTSNVKVQKALYEAVEGATNVFNRDMAAVGTDEVIDMFLDGMPTGLIAKSAKWTTRNAIQRPMLKILGTGKYKATVKNTENIFSTAHELINEGKGAFNIGMSKGGGLGSGIVAATARSSASLIPGLTQRIKTIQEMSKNIPQKLLSKIPGYGVKDNTTLKYASDLAGRTMASGISEGIEEGKQYLHGKAWEEGQVDRDKKGIANILLHDFEAGSKSALVALGIPFRLELTSDAEMIENIKGGMAGGMLHTGGVRVISQAIPYVRQLKMDDIIYQNMMLDKLADRYTYIKGKTYSQHASDLGIIGRNFGVGLKRMSESFDNLIEFMENRKANGQEFIDTELIQKEKDRMHKVVALSNSKSIREVAKQNNIDPKKNKNLFNSLVSAISMYREKDSESRNNMFQHLNIINESVNASLNGIFEEQQKEQDKKIQEDIENNSEETQIIEEKLDVDKEVLDKKLVTHKGYIKPKQNEPDKEDEQEKDDSNVVNYSQRERAKIQMHAAAELKAIKQILNEIEGKTDSHSIFLRNYLKKRIDKIKGKIINNNWKDFYENTDQYIIDETVEEDLETEYRDVLFHSTDNEIYQNILKTFFGKNEKDYQGLNAINIIGKINKSIEQDEQLEQLIEDDFRQQLNQVQKDWDDAMAELDKQSQSENVTSQEDATNEINTNAETVTNDQITELQNEPYTNNTLQEELDKKSSNIKKGETISYKDEDGTVITLTVTKKTKSRKIVEMIDVSNKGIVYVKDGKLLSKKEREELLNKANQIVKTNEVYETIKVLNDTIEEQNGRFDPKNTTGMDYFAEVNGRLIRYNRVHTVIDSWFGNSWIHEAEEEQINQMYKSLLNLYKNSTIDELIKELNVYENTFKNNHGVSSNIQVYIKYIQQKHVYGNFKEVDATLYNIASNFVNFVNNPSVTVGTIVDEICRLYFGGKYLDYNAEVIIKGEKHNVSDYMTQRVFDSFTNDLKQLKDYYEKELGWTLFTNRIIWNGQFISNTNTVTRIAGETDMIAVDKLGKIHIIDYKTSLSDFKGKYFEIKQDKQTRSTKEQYTLQLSTYEQLIKATVGERLSSEPIELMPIQVGYERRHFDVLVNDFKNKKSDISPIEFIKGLKEKDGKPRRILLSSADILSDGTELAVSSEESDIEELVNFAESCLDLVYEINNSEYEDKINTIKSKIRNSNIEQRKYIEDQLITIREELINKLEQQLDNQTKDQRKSDIQKKIEELSNLLEKAVDRHSQILKENPGNTLYAVVQDKELANIMEELVQKSTIFAEQNYDTSDDKLNKVRSLIQWYNNQQEKYKNNQTNSTKPAPIQKTGKLPWWEEHNSIERSDIQKSVAIDNPSIRLEDVITNDDFDINSECELTYEYGIIYGTITYNGHAFKRVAIRPAKTQEGIVWKNAVIKAIQDSIQRSTKEKPLKVVATSMDRTSGSISSTTEPIPVNKSKLIKEKTSYNSDEISVDDISLDFGSNWGVVGPMQPDGSQQIRTKGQQDGQFDVIHTIKQNIDVAGSISCVVKKKYRNGEFSVICTSKKFNEKLIGFIIERLYDDMDTVFPGTPFTNRETINILLPYGQYNKKNPTVHIRKIPNSNSVEITGPNNLKAVYNIDNDNSKLEFIKFLKNQYVNRDFDFLSSHIGSKNSKIRKYFQNNININEIRLGNTGIIITRDMVFNSKNNEGITGLSLFIQNGLLETKYNGITNCRVCYNGVQVIEKSFKPQQAEKKEGDETIQPILGPKTLEEYKEENEQQQVGELPSLDDLLSGNMTDFLLMEKKEGDKLVKTDINKIEKFFKKLFGDQFTFDVVKDLSQISASCVGVCFADAGRIALAQEIVEGTEYHEAFHRIVELFLSDTERNILYSSYRRKYARQHSMSIKAVKETLTEKDIAEGLAEMYRNYMLDIEAIGESNKSLFGKIKAHVNALYKIGSIRGIIAIAITNIYGKYRFKNKKPINERIERFKKKFGDQLTLKVRNGNFNNIPDRKTYDMLIESLVYYFIRANGSIKITGENADKISIDPEMLKYKKEGQKYSLYELLTSKQIFNPIIADAMKEIFDNFDQVSPDIAQRISAMSSDYKVKYENEEEQEGVDGDGDTGIGSKIEEHTKASYEFSKIDKTSRQLRFFMSMIEDQELNKDGKLVAKRNAIGHRRFMNYKEVMTTLLNDLSDCQSVSEMLLEMNSRASWNPIYAQITPTLNAYWSNANNKNNPNYDQEQFVTQLYNLLRSNKNKFKIAKSQKMDSMYTIRIIDSGSDYESRQYRSDWGTYLMNGVTPLFKRDENGKIVEKPRGVATLGAIFNRMQSIQEAFTTQNLKNIQNGKESSLKLKINGQIMTLDPTNPEHIQIIKKEFIRMLNFIGIQFHMEEFNYLLTKKYGNIKDGTNHTIDPLGFGGLRMFFTESGFDNVAQLWNSDTSIISYDKFDGKWKLNIQGNKIVKNNGRRINAENVFINNSFAGMLSSAKYQYVHSTDELTVLATGGNKYYVVSENNVVSDITKDLNVGTEEIEKLKKSSFVYFDGKTEDQDGRIINTGVEGSIIVKTMSEDGHPRLEVCTMAGFKTDEVGDQGADYQKITEREDYISKIAILQNGGIIFPTMSDKKTYHWLEGIKLPGIDYEKLEQYIYGFREDGVTLNISEDVLDQFIEYADCEFRNIQKTLYILDKIPNSQKVANYHKGAKIKDKDGNEHQIANGCVFTVLPGIYKEDGTYVSFTKFLDDNGNFISESKNLQKATEEFFSLNTDEKREIMRRTLQSKLKSELDKIESLGLIKKVENDALKFPYENVGLDSYAINSIAKNINPNNPSSALAQSQAICIYVQDMINKTAMSLMEIERCYSGHPGAFKYKFENGVLVDRQVDQFKRLGGLSSTGVNNNLELMGIPREYTCAELNDQEGFISEQFEEIRKNIEEGEYRQAYYNYLVQQYDKKLSEKEEDYCAETAYNTDLTVDEIKTLLPENIKYIVDKHVDKMSNAYSDINVSDGSTFVSDRMCEWMLRQVGSFNEEIKQAFKILRSDKVSIEKQLKYYHKIVTAVIGAQKYTAFGLNMNENNELIPYYHKTAMFPLFKCMATGKMSKMLQQMHDQGVDMVLMNSSVKVGSQGSQEYSIDDDFKFNTYKRDFKYLRKQFNTDPHHREEMQIGTQMMKVIFSSLLKGKDYNVNGKTIKGRELLQLMMDCINNLAEIGANEIYNRFIQDDKLNVEEFSKFLTEQLQTREADKNLIEAIQLEYSYDSEGKKIKGSGRFKQPLAATSGMAFVQSIIVSMINKKVVDVNTDGNAFYQRSAFNMENDTIDVLDDENIPDSLNNGKSLQMINEYGCIDCVLSIDYFSDILEKAGLKYSSFNEQKEFLKKHGIIGGKPTLVGYRIPTQAQSSIHAMRCVDVLPVVNHTIMLPKDFTKTTGSDRKCHCLNQYNIKYFSNCWKLHYQSGQSAAKP